MDFHEAWYKHRATLPLLFNFLPSVIVWQMHELLRREKY